MNNENNNIQNFGVNSNYQPVIKKKKNKTLIVGLSVVGVVVFAVAISILIFNIEFKTETPWQSGNVAILGKKIQLPCKRDQFETILNTKIVDSEVDPNSEIKDVKINLGIDALVFSVYTEGNYVTGVMIDAYASDESIDKYSTFYSKRNTAKQIVFPGNVTIESNIKDVVDLYKTKPFNVFYTFFSEDITDNWVSSHYKYQGNDWEIEVQTENDEITGIDYWYLGEI